MKNKYGVKLLIFLFLFVLPFYIDGLTYSGALDISGNYMNDNDYKSSYARYIYTPTNFEKFYDEDYNSFKLGGMLSYEEFMVTTKDKGINYSYLYESKPFWTLTRGVNSSDNIVIGSGFPNVSRDALSSATSNIGTKVTEFIKSNVKINGKGTYNNPWIFAPTYKVVIKVNDFDKGYILDNGNKVEQIEYAFENSSHLEYINIGTLGANKYIGSTCGYIINDIEADTNKRLLLSNVTRDIECVINFGEAPITINLYQQTNDYNSIPEVLYVLPQKGWYSDQYGNSQITNITSIPSKIGYTFKGYYNSTSMEGACSATKYIDESGKLVTDTSILKDLTHGQTLYPCYQANTYVVTFDANDNGEGNVPNPQTKNVVFDKPYDSLASVSRTGYTFAGWYDSKNNLIDALDNVTTPSNHTLYAKWNKNSYSITYVLDGGSKGSGSFPESAYYSDSVYIDAPTKVGYTFAGWTVSGDLNTSTATFGSSASTVSTNAISSTSSKITTRYVANLCSVNNGSVTLTAQWIANTDTKYVVNHYQQNLNASDTENTSNYTLANTQTLEGTTASIVTPGVKTYTGFVSPDTQTITILANGTAVLNYYYKRSHYTVTVNVNNTSYGSVSTASISLDYGNTYSASGATLSFVNGSSSVASATSAVGYTTSFSSWSSNSGTITSDTTITATFSRTANTNTAYTVKHHKQNIADNNYTLADTENLTGTTAVNVSPNTKSYTGFTAPSKQTKAILADGSLVIDYYYTRNSYTVTVNKGTGISATSGSGTYKYGASVTAGYTLNTGYHFVNWTGGKTSATFTMPASNVTMTANGAANSYTVTYDCNGGTGSTASSSHTYGTAKNLTTNGCSKADNSFSGWNTKADGSGTEYADGASVNNLTNTNNGTVKLYAQWAQTYKDEIVAGTSGVTEFPRTSHKSWSSGGPVRLLWQEYYNAATNQSYIQFTAFQAKSGSGIGVMWVGGGKDETRGIFILDEAGNKETIQAMSYHLGDTNFNFLSSTVNTWINVNTYSTNPTTSPPWTSKTYTHNDDGTLTLTFRVDMLILTQNSSNYGSWDNVDVDVVLTDLRY